ncbi:MAG: AAA family ATPase [Lachnospiraceae bacterium]|nr:AAA family ATPase [Lachnospiraceae bacterium]
MRATHRVKDSAENPVGYIVDGKFYTDEYLKTNIQYVENLSLEGNTVRYASAELEEISYKAAVAEKEYHKIVSENPFVRDIQEDLEEWRQDASHKVLQLEGSRQIGKTTELLKFAYKNYEYIIYVNLAYDKYDFLETVNSGGSPLEFEKYCLKAGLPHFVNNRNTVLLIDEIQLSEKIYNSIRSLYSEIDCDMIVTGSYLGQTLQAGYFLPAGTVSYIHMFPLSFSEFCRIYDKEEILKSMDLFGDDNGRAYNEILPLYHVYRQIGGYPEVVRKYREKEDINSCYNVIQSLVETFQRESGYYFRTSKEALLFKTVFTEAIKSMCSEKRGSGNKLTEKITNIAKQSQKMLVSRDETASAITWLVYSGIIGECGLYNNGDIRQYIPARRLYYMDCGIAAYVGRGAEVDESSIEGLLTETFVYTELYRLYKKVYSKKAVKGETPCFSLYSQYELDFVLVDKDNTVYGVEVKTGDGSPESLRIFIDRHLIDRGIVAKPVKGGHGEKFDTIPIFAVGCRFPYMHF